MLMLSLLRIYFLFFVVFGMILSCLLIVCKIGVVEIFIYSVMVSYFWGSSKDYLKFIVDIVWDFRF